MTTRTPNSFPLTDSGNGELIASMYGDRLRFNHRKKCWLAWGGGHWVEDRDGQVYRFAKATARARAKAALDLTDPDDKKAAVTWALSSESHHRLKAALELAKTTIPIADKGDRWDSNPFLLGVDNGIVDLRTGLRRDARPDDRITLQATVRYDPSARCPRFMQFLHQVFLGDEELIGFIQKAIGYSLTGDITEQCLFLCYGAGANGKSTLLETIRYCLGGHAHNLPFSAFELKARSSIPNDVAQLLSKRFVTSVETNENARFNEARVKALTGGDQITARFLYGEYFSFDPTAKFWLAVNHKPRVTDDSNGFWRRIRLIPFLAKFDSAEQDKNLAAKLRAEGSGILAWAVQGCLDWQRAGLGIPQAVNEATQAYRDESNPFAEFLEQCYVCCPDGETESARILQDYKDWVYPLEPTLNSTSMASRLEARGFERIRIGHERTRGWRGLKPKDDAVPGPGGAADTRTAADTVIQ